MTKGEFIDKLEEFFWSRNVSLYDKLVEEFLNQQSEWVIVDKREDDA